MDFKKKLGKAIAPYTPPKIERGTAPASARKPRSPSRPPRLTVDESALPPGSRRRAVAAQNAEPSKKRGRRA